MQYIDTLEHHSGNSEKRILANKKSAERSTKHPERRTKHHKRRTEHHERRTKHHKRCIEHPERRTKHSEPTLFKVSCEPIGGQVHVYFI